MDPGAAVVDRLNVGRAAFMLGSYVAAVWVYPTVLSAPNRAKVSAYLGSRFGIAIA